MVMYLGGYVCILGVFVTPPTEACCIAASFYFEVPDPEALVLDR